MLKIRYILMLLLGVWAIPLSASTSTINQSTLVSSFNETSHSVSWDAEDHKVTFTLAGTNKAIYSTLGNLYMASGPVGLVPQNTGATFTLSWSVDADYNLAVSKVTINVDKASGAGSHITVGDGSRSGDLFSFFTVKNLSTGSKVYTTFESVPIVFEKAGTWSTVAVNYITITYTLTPKFIFLGNGGGGESEQLKWEKKENWFPGKLPTINDSVFIRHDAVITGNATAKSVTIESPNKVTVAPTGTLKVGDGGVKNASADNFKLEAAQTGTNKGQTGALLIDPACSTMPSATAEMYSKAYFDMNVDASERNNAGAYQYVGSPMVAGTAAKTIFPNSWVYSWFEDSGEWKNKRKTLTLEPFVGYCTSQYMDPAGILIEHKGQLASNGNRVLDLSYTATSAEPGINVLANSYSAPIDITQFIDGDFVGDVEKTIYLFNTGSKNDVKEHPELNGDLAGQFIAIPIHQAGEMVGSFQLPFVIPAMQGFYVKANSAGSTLALNYKRLVWNATHSNTPLRAKRAEEQKKGSLCVMVEADGWRDQVYLLESEEYDAAFENGYDAHKLMQGNLNIFTLEGEEALAVDATNRIAGTKIGVRTGEETAYTLTFGALSGETEWSLFDAQAQETIAIEEGTQYTFFAEPNSEIRDRFYITERNDAPAITTDLENVVDGTESRKFIKDGRLFVMKNGLIYNMLGVVVSR
jgi:hypothetical protein